MGQGRHPRPLLRSVLLIASAIQGITPDSRNLASPLAISVVAPFLLGQRVLDENDRSPDEACLAVQVTSPWQAHHPVYPCRAQYPAPDRQSPHQIPWVIGNGVSTFGRRPLEPDLSLTLCRLVC